MTIQFDRGDRDIVIRELIAADLSTDIHYVNTVLSDVRSSFQQQFNEEIQDSIDELIMLREIDHV